MQHIEIPRGSWRQLAFRAQRQGEEASPGAQK